MQETITQETDLQIWFDNLVATIRKDQLLLESGIAPKEIKEAYNLLMCGNNQKLQVAVRNLNSSYFIEKLVLSYIQELNARKSAPVKLALQLSESKILVWAEIKDNDEKTEDALLLAEAKINAEYHKFGFNISSTIMEESDNYPIPEQFSMLT